MPACQYYFIIVLKIVLDLVFTIMVKVNTSQTRARIFVRLSQAHTLPCHHSATEVIFY